MILCKINKIVSLKTENNNIRRGIKMPEDLGSLKVTRQSESVDILPYDDARISELAKVLGFSDEYRLVKLITSNSEEISARQKVNQWIYDHIWDVKYFSSIYQRAIDENIATLPEVDYPFLGYIKDLKRKKQLFGDN